MKKYPDKKILFSLLVVGVFASFVGARYQNYGAVVAHKLNINSASVLGAPSLSQVEPKPAMSPLTLADNPSVTLGFVGDIMLDRGVRKSVNKNFAGDYSKLFENTDFLKTPDIMFANLEGPVSDKGSDKHNLYSFRMDPQVLSLIKESGIDVLSVANNHMGDWRYSAFVDTINRIRDAGLIPCGGGLTRAEAVQPAVVEKDGYKVGFICFSDVGPNDLSATDTKAGILLASDEDYDEIIKNASENVDALIVSFHWGTEYKKIHNSRQESLAHRAIDAGAIMVEGEHPHIPQDFGSYKNAPILYSLGNFIFDQSWSKETMHGLFVTATLSGKTISNIEKHQVELNNNFTPSLLVE